MLDSAAAMALSRLAISMAFGQAEIIAARMLAASSVRGLSSVMKILVGAGAGNLSHFGALALVTVAATSKQHSKLASGGRAQCG